jgi:hypothetical protein
VNDKEGNKHAKNSEHEHFIPRDDRPQTAPYGLLPGERPAQFVRHTPSLSFLLEAGDEGESARLMGTK